MVAAQQRRKIPFWALPVVAVLPVWGFVYAGVLATPEAEISDPVLVLGEEIYGNCAGCHGAEGGGGQGRPLADGDVLLTFPNIEDHIAWVTEGSALVGGAGNPYGNPDRPGGQRISGSDGYGQMAGWGPTLTEEEIFAVVRYEREVLSGGVPEGEAAADEDGAGATAPDSEVDADPAGGALDGEGNGAVGASGTAGDPAVGGSAGTGETSSEDPVGDGEAADG